MAKDLKLHAHVNLKRNFMFVGFTLIEIIVVIAIIVILASIVFSIYKNFIKSATEVNPVQILLTASTAMERYYADYDAYPDKIEKLSGFNDGNEDNQFCTGPENNPKRRFCITIANHTDDSYCLEIHNQASGDWKIKWRLCCNATAPIGSCKPEQIKGSSLLKHVY